MKKICLILAAVFCLVFLQAFAEETLYPYDVSEPWIDFNNGVFRCSIRELEGSGSFQLELYLEDRYNLDVIMSMDPGRTVWVAGKELTVKKIVAHESEREFDFELIPEEDYFSYVVFRPLTNGSCTVMVDDWPVLTELGWKEIRQPLRDDFRYIAEDGTTGGEYDLLRDLAAYGDDFVPYNTYCVIVDGQLRELGHDAYPTGPN